MNSTRNTDMDNKTSKNAFKMCCATSRLCETAFPHLWSPFWFCRRLVLYLMSCNTLNLYICNNLFIECCVFSANIWSQKRLAFTLHA